MKGPKKFYVIIIFIILTLSSLIILWNITDNILSRRTEGKGTIYVPDNPEKMLEEWK